MDQVLASFVRLLSTIDPIAFSVGPISVRWYGIAYIVGVAIGLWVLTVFADRWKISLSNDDLVTIALAAIAGILVGGRLGYCLFYGGTYYFLHPLEVFSLWDGGMSFHGGLIGALIGGWFASRATGVPYLTLVDMGAVGAPIGLFLGRMANFSMESFGVVPLTLLGPSCLKAADHCVDILLSSTRLSLRALFWALCCLLLRLNYPQGHEVKFSAGWSRFMESRASALSFSESRMWVWDFCWVVGLRWGCC